MQSTQIHIDRPRPWLAAIRRVLRLAQPRPPDPRHAEVPEHLRRDVGLGPPAPRRRTTGPPDRPFLGPF